MKNDQAISLLHVRVPGNVAADIILSIDISKYELYGVEGFLVRPEGHEASLDLIFDLSSVMNLTAEEKREFIATFVKNRSTPETLFEVHGEPIEDTQFRGHDT